MGISVMLLKRYWKHILSMLSLILTVYLIYDLGRQHGYKQGYSEAVEKTTLEVSVARDKFWQQQIESVNKIYHAQIEEAERQAALAVNELDVERQIRKQQQQKAEQQIQALKKQINTVTTSNGQVCEDTYLGIEFIQTWNAQSFNWSIE